MDHKQTIQSHPDMSINIVEEMRENPYLESRSPKSRSGLFERHQIDQEDEPEEIDIMNGYLTYDLSEFHGMLGENVGLHLGGSYSDSEDEGGSREQTQGASNIIPHSVSTVQGQAGQYSRDQQFKAQISSEIHIDLDDPEDLEDDEHDLDMEGLDCQSDDENNDDIDLFDSVDESFDENSNPYKLTVKYPTDKYNVSIKHPQMEYSNQNKQAIFLRNSEILSDRIPMDDFYYHLRQLGFQCNKKVLKFEDHLRFVMLLQLQSLIKRFEKYRSHQQKWLEVSPSYTQSGMLQTFSILLERFTELTKHLKLHYQRDAIGQKNISGRITIQLQLPEEHKQSRRDNINRTRSALTSTREIEIQKPKVLTQQNDEYVLCTLLSITLFKAEELLSQYHKFLHVRRQSPTYKKIVGVLGIMQSRLRLAQFICKDGVYLIQKFKQQSTSRFSSQLMGDQQPSGPSVKARRTIHASELFTQGFQYKKIMGTEHIFQPTNVIIDTQLLKIRNQSRNQRLWQTEYHDLQHEEAF